MNMQTYKELYLMNFDALYKEIEMYSSTEKIWEKPDGINNPAGNLVLHLLGNLNHNMGVALGKTGYVRKRDEEFSRKDVSKEELLEQLRATREVLKDAFDKAPDEMLTEKFPFQILKEEKTTAFMLSFFLAHMTYHLGQINYHRRLLA
jgi:uncharacterized damage-inducible protein DinB